MTVAIPGAVWDIVALPENREKSIERKRKTKYTCIIHMLSNQEIIHNETKYACV